MAKAKTVEAKKAVESPKVQAKSDNGQYVAKAHYISISPIKLRRVANLVRRKDVNTALNILSNLPHKGAELLYKTIQSAKANAKNNFNVDDTFLNVDELLINEGPRSRRFQPKARGRIYKIIKRTAHIIVVLKQRGGN